MSDSSLIPTIGRQTGALALPAGILVVVAMMVLPLPVALLDVFFVGNILLSLLILMVALHTFRPLDFSSFPSMLLIATVLRLALNVASTRIVLTHGHTGEGAAGKVIQAFGEFVIAGNFLVGLLVFMILVIINLVVITKGAGRVSEVSARFTLDAMPGKQMAIDADLNAGLLTPEEARSRRADISSEADFYGAMDGASKFVKGDAVAGILILVINIIGGVLIGTVQYNMSFGMASQTYTLLSIGDGLVAQIPALLLSLATAIIVTRVSSANDMSELISRQVNLSRAWLPVAGVMGILGLVPGMPNMMFLLGAVAAGVAAWLGYGREKRIAEEGGSLTPGLGGTVAQGGTSTSETDGTAPETIMLEDVADNAPISLQIGYGLIPLAGQGEGQLVPRITALRRDTSRALGFVVPGVRIRDDLSLAPNQYRIRIGQEIVAEDHVFPDRKLAIPGDASVQKPKGVEVKDPSFGLDAVWILPHQVLEVEADDYVVVEPESVIATHLSRVISKHAHLLMGPDEVQELLDTLAKSAPTLVSSVIPKLIPLHRLTTILRTLLAERIPVSDLRRVLEGLSDMPLANLSGTEMTEALRPLLAPLLLQEIAPLSQPLPLITFNPELEQLLLRSRQQGADESLLIDQALGQRILETLSKASDEVSKQGRTAVLIVATPLRRSLARWLRPHLPDVIVMGITELPETRQIEVVAAIGAPGALQGQSAEGGNPKPGGNV